jgi:transcriptional regulator
MYIPKHFEEPRTEVLHELMRAQPLATLITFSADGLDANHIPLQIAATPHPFGTLRGHVARANPLLDGLKNDVEALAVFQGPEAYISPSWYESKKVSGKVVPTWNYAVAHAYGYVRIVDDRDWLRTQIESLTTQHEAQQQEPWAVADAPSDYIEKLLGAIVGIEIVITRLLGKWKVSQNQPHENQLGVIAGLRAAGTSSAIEVADLVAVANAPKGLS